MSWFFGIIAHCEATEYISKSEQTSSRQTKGKEDLVLVDLENDEDVDDDDDDEDDKTTATTTTN